MSKTFICHIRDVNYVMHVYKGLSDVISEGRIISDAVRTYLAREMNDIEQR